MAQFGWSINIDFLGFDLDSPVGEPSISRHQSSLASFLHKAGKNILREAIIDYSSMDAYVDLVCTPGSVAEQIAKAMHEVGGDGFLITLPNNGRRSVAEVADGLMPALQRRGPVQKKHENAQFRDNLLAYSPDRGIPGGLINWVARQFSPRRPGLIDVCFMTILANGRVSRLVVPFRERWSR